MKQLPKTVQQIIETLNSLKYPYSLPDLPYPYDALEPYIDSQTMQIHHTKHHAGYVNNLNKVLEPYKELHQLSLPELLQNLNELDLPDEDLEKIRNHGGGHLNHTLFWQIMNPALSGDKELVALIESAFESIDNFKTLFSQTAKTHFGSGWAWLVITPQGQPEIYSLLNQDSPYLLGDTPILGLDVWEHAYYLKYQNRRAEYVDNWWNVLKVI